MPNQLSDALRPPAWVRVPIQLFVLLTWPISGLLIARKAVADDPALADGALLAYALWSTAWYVVAAIAASAFTA